MFGVAAIAAIAGLSVPRAYKRLTNIGATDSSTSSTPTASQSPTVTAVSPSTVTAAALPQTVTVTGTNLTKAAFLLNGRAVLPDTVADTTATFIVKPGDVDAGHAIISLAPNVGSSASIRIN